MKTVRIQSWLLMLLIFSVFVLNAQDHNEKIDLQLRWFHQFQFAGFYAAKELGYYEKAGLDVNIIEGGIDTDVMKEVVSGRAEYGVQTPSILIDRANGNPVVVLSVIFQHSPVALIVNKESGIENPSQLIGKTIMLGGKNTEIRAMLSSEAVLDKVNIIEFTGNYQDLIDNKVDGASGYVTDVSYIENQEINTFSYLRPITYGIDFYGDCLFTSENEIKNNSERVLSFKQASLDGWTYAMENPEKIIDLIITKYKSKASKEKLYFEYTQMNKLMHPDLVEIGHINPGRWKHIAETYQKLGVMKPDFELKGFIYTDYYTENHMIFKAVFIGIIILLLAGLIIVTKNYLAEKKKELEEERKHKEILMKSEAKFRGLIEFGADGILLGSQEGYIIEVNEMACSIMGMNKEDLIGKYVTAVPFTKESIEKTPLRFDLLKEGKTVVNERDILRPDGSIVNIEMKTKMMADKCYQTIFRDVTLRKIAEKKIGSLKSRFEYVLGATKTGFDIIDEENNVIYVDPKWAEKLGDYHGRKCYEYFMGKSEQCANCAIPNALENGITTISEEHLEKENRFIEVHTIYLNEKLNGKMLVAEFNIDITEKKKIEKQLREFNLELETKVQERTAQLEESNRELESFSYSVSHDLRAPVRHIYGFTDILAKKIKNNNLDNIDDTLKKISDSSLKMEKLIDDLLNFSRTSRQEMKKENLNLNQIVKNALDETANMANGRNIKWEINDLPAAHGDRNLLLSVWINLIDNAVKYTGRKDKAEISIGCKENENEQEFYIKDNGVGFDMTFYHKLFGVFQRLHLEKDFPGTGIGLANVRRIISRHGGKTWAESEGEGKGASFYFTLPKKSGNVYGG